MLSFCHERWSKGTTASLNYASNCDFCFATVPEAPCEYDTILSRGGLPQHHDVNIQMYSRAGPIMSCCSATVLPASHLVLACCSGIPRGLGETALRVMDILGWRKDWRQNVCVHLKVRMSNFIKRQGGVSLCKLILIHVVVQIKTSRPNRGRAFTSFCR